MSASSSPTTSSKGISIDLQLIAYFALWYLGNYYYNITNKLALKAAGGAAGFPLTIATLQLGVGCLYALFLWAAPDARKLPKITKEDVIKMIPVAFCAAAAHSFSVFALSAGAVSFGQIVKAAEPAFAALLGVTLYQKKLSLGKWLCLIPVIGGVVLASVKELDFAWSALITACIANLFAAFKGQENQKLMTTPGIKDRLGNVGNQFAITMILSFLLSVPVMIAKEGAKWGQFCSLWQTTPAVTYNLIASGLWFYGYNELATMTIKKTNAVTQSVANTAKRVIVIIGVAIVLRESLDPIKLLGCAIGIGGVFLYSIIDLIFPPSNSPAAPRKLYGWQKNKASRPWVKRQQRGILRYRDMLQLRYSSGPGSDTPSTSTSLTARMASKSKTGRRLGRSRPVSAPPAPPAREEGSQGQVNQFKEVTEDIPQISPAVEPMRTEVKAVEKPRVAEASKDKFPDGSVLKSPFGEFTMPSWFSTGKNFGASA
ncbi:hypothetical protein GUITHDRAFT_81079 [Guillardia theta CCMP2712]|uniref:Sugar phosphate transporter domain-containing protein n=2 Tax=Guillardia theta TaxID=55529 RepID=L1ID37_GUITC|nr:hypothetical protein GUITHDRAFT_81079 [Guillardia theta CCMP2712]EKX33804.1 hypothetical protein GUITHDRAFT_81079 [Guillardia theta CCMP2712]|eukprot:XP_005820784.1 hypothetical protein GUITHDRAFT_81079 [Guillardia theta CCMP2712]